MRSFRRCARFRRFCALPSTGDSRDHIAVVAAACEFDINIRCCRADRRDWTGGIRSSRTAAIDPILSDSWTSGLSPRYVYACLWFASSRLYVRRGRRNLYCPCRCARLSRIGALASGIRPSLIERGDNVIVGRATRQTSVGECSSGWTTYGNIRSSTRQSPFYVISRCTRGGLPSQRDLPSSRRCRQICRSCQPHQECRRGRNRTGSATAPILGCRWRSRRDRLPCAR